MEIHQVIVSAAPGDAITDTALRQRALLRRIGPSEVYARHVHPDCATEVRRLRHYVPRQEREGREPNIVIFHASTGDPEVVSFLVDQGDRIVVMYHNVTPARFFEQADPGFARLLEAGRSELRYLRPRVDLALAVSAHNATELEAMGFRDVRISPPVVDVRPDATPVDEGMLAGIDRVLGPGGPTLLYVGQLLPHKRIDLLLQAFHVLSTYLLPEARLLVTGFGRLPHHRDALERLIHELGLYRAALTGHVTPGQLAACWEAADVFVTASEHEGFCVPLVEAMAHRVPVLARRCAAIPETVGDAGLLVDADAGPELLAEAMAELVTNRALQAELDRRAAIRLRAFDPDLAAARFLRHLLSVV